MSTHVSCKIDGMTCGNCALTVEKFLEKQGASDIVANSATGELNFTKPEHIEEANLFKDLEKLGYPKVEDNESDDNHQHKPNNKERNLLIISTIFWLPLIAHMFVSWEPLHNPFIQFLLCIPTYIICIIYFGKNALRSLKNKMPNMDVLVFIGASAAFIYSIIGWQFYPEQASDYLFFETCASIVTLVLLGNYLEQVAVKTTASSLTELIKLQKTTARIVFTDSIGKETILEVPNSQVKTNDILQVNNGDNIPVDGIVLKGQALINESMMTGESLPTDKKEGKIVIGGTVVENGSFRMQATEVGKNTALSQIIQLVNKAQATKAPMQKLADKISAIFVPVVIGIAILTFLINYFIADISFAQSMMRTIAVMVISCPCAMGLATPAAVMVGMGRAARNGILIKGGDTLQKFTNLKHILFDKTGTLTTGKLKIGNIQILDSRMSENSFKEMILGLEQHSSHPIAKSFVDQWKVPPHNYTEVEEIKGKGIKGRNEDGDRIEIGSFRIAQKLTTERHDLFVLRNGALLGFIDLEDELRPEAKFVIKSLKAKGYKLAILSGDRKEKCQAVAKTLGIKSVFFEQLPHEKLAKIEELSQQGGVAMIGDGINDSPALSQADIGISLSDATQIAMQTANVILSNNTLEALPEAIGLGKHTFLTIKQNLFWAFLYNIVAIPVAALGFLTPTFGAGVMALSDVVLIVNSLRLRFKRVS